MLCLLGEDSQSNGVRKTAKDIINRLLNMRHINNYTDVDYTKKQPTERLKID